MTQINRVVFWVDELNLHYPIENPTEKETIYMPRFEFETVLLQRVNQLCQPY